MIANGLEQDPNTDKVNKNAIYYDKIIGHVVFCHNFFMEIEREKKKKRKKSTFFVCLFFNRSCVWILT